jgi:hypothetical protein
MSAHHRTVMGWTTRFMVYRELRRVMDREGRCPTEAEVTAALGTPYGTAAWHMRALRGADGLPLPIPGVLARHAERAERGGHYFAGITSALVETAPVEVDLLMSRGRL